MNLADQYERQYRWRSWQLAYAALPPLAGTRVLDLGCAIGDQARDLTELGAKVLGIDADENLLARASSREIPGAVFELGDVRSPATGGDFDGIWGSFVAAYFTDLVPVLARWRNLLRPGGWIALTEVSGLFRHEPLPVGARTLLDTYARESRQVGRYDFDMGSKLASHFTAAGLKVEVDRLLPDRELSFTGAGEQDVLDAWKARLARMSLLQDCARDAYPSLQEDLLGCLAMPHHATECRVHFCLARRLPT
jgi:SAM-dependent methyltransferase